MNLGVTNSELQKYGRLVPHPPSGSQPQYNN